MRYIEKLGVPRHFVFSSVKRTFPGWREVDPDDGGVNYDVGIRTPDGRKFHLYSDGTGWIYNLKSFAEALEKARSLYPGDPGHDEVTIESLAEFHGALKSIRDLGNVAKSLCTSDNFERWDGDLVSRMCSYHDPETSFGDGDFPLA